jgi:hypothetical protein
MPDDAIDFELVTNAGQLATPPPLSRERVVLSWKTTSGKSAAMYVSELTALEFGEYQESMRVYEGGGVVGVSMRHDDLRFLSYVCRDAHGNRIWQTTDAAIEQLGRYGRASITSLLAAANRVNRADEDPASAEGNSEPTRTGS